MWQYGRGAFLPAVCAAVVLLLFFFVFTPQEKQLEQATPLTPEKQLEQATPPPPEKQLAQATPPPSVRPKCGVTKVSMLYGAHRFPQLEDALLSHKRHAERFGCSFAALDHDIATRKMYSKPYFLLSTMLQELIKPAEERQQWLMWVDADSLVVNPALSPELFLPPDHLQDVYALVTADQNGLNNGLFYIKVHPSSLDLLTQTLDYPLAHPDEDLGWSSDQAAMANVIKAIEANSTTTTTTTSPGIAWVPRKWFNAYQTDNGFEGDPGSAYVHFAGLGETRLMHMADWLDELQRNQAKWEKPLHQTYYQQSIKDFWKEFEANITAQL